MSQYDSEKVDVVIVGAGAASSVYAALLAEAGKSVLILEKGPARKLTDLVSSQIWARRLKWASHHVVEEGSNPIQFNFNAGHGYGGAAIHHYGVWPRYHPEDFKLRSLYGKGLDWPFEYNDLRPYYDRVQSDVGMSGDAEQEIWRPEGDPYPLPPVLVSNHGRVLEKGFTKLGIHTSPVPTAVLSRPYKGRPGCIWDGWCDAGCPTGALANPLVVYFPRAEKAGARFKSQCNVTRVLTDKKGRRAIGVEYFDQARNKKRQLADMVILTAFTVENVRILLNSASSLHPDGLANSSGLLGKYLMTHPSMLINGMFEEEMENHIGITGGQLFSQDAYDKEAVPGAFGSRQWEIGLALKPNDILGVAMSRGDLFGASLDRFIRKGVHHLGSMVGVCEELPIEQNRIELRAENDEYGMPLVRAIHSADDDAKKLWQIAADEGTELFKAAGAKDAWHSPPGAQHTMGGTIMGDSPEASVVNAYCQSHELSNLVIGGPSVFPTPSCVNSTFTVHAVSMMSAEHLAAHWAAVVS